MPHLAARHGDARRRGPPHADLSHAAHLQRRSQFHDGRVGRARDVGRRGRDALGAHAVLGTEAPAVQGADRARHGGVWRGRGVQGRGKSRRLDEIRGGQTNTHARLDFPRYVHGGTAGDRKRHRVRLRQRREHDAALGRAGPRRRGPGAHPGIDARDSLRARCADRQRALVERRSDRVLESLHRADRRQRPRLHRHLRRRALLLRRGVAVEGCYQLTASSFQLPAPSWKPEAGSW